MHSRSLEFQVFSKFRSDPSAPGAVICVRYADSACRWFSLQAWRTAVAAERQASALSVVCDEVPKHGAVWARTQEPRTDSNRSSSMAKFYTDVQAGTEYATYVEGQEFENIEAARESARRSAHQLVAD
jgi:hypothetical protein